MPNPASLAAASVPSSLMYYYSGVPMHFFSGVDTRPKSGVSDLPQRRKSGFMTNI